MSASSLQSRAAGLGGQWLLVSFRDGLIPQGVVLVRPVTRFHSPCFDTSESSCHEEASFAGLLKVTQICLPVVRSIHLSDCRVTTGCEKDKCDGGGGMRNCSIFAFISTSLSCKFHFQSVNTLIWYVLITYVKAQVCIRRHL